MTTALARAIEGIPVVGSTAERDLLFAVPQTDQRVQLRATGEMQRYSGTAWLSDLGFPNTGGRTVLTLAAYLDNNKIINLRDYGVLPTSTAAQNVTAFQAVLTGLTGAAHVVLPGGFYNFDNPVTWPTAFPIVFEGEGQYVTRISYSGAGALGALFKLDTAGTRYEGNVFRGFQVLGNSKLACVIDTMPGTFANRAYASHTIIDDVQVFGTTLWCFRLSDCYSTTIRDCPLFSNTGGGLAIVGAQYAQNNINVLSCPIYANGGVGILLQSGFGVTIHGCGIETNALGGIVAYDLQGLNVVEGYTERNGATGYTYTSPALTVKADILLSASTTIGTLDLTGSMSAVRIIGNSVTPLGSAGGPAGSPDCFVFTNRGDGLTVEGNKLYDITKYAALVQIYDPTGAAVISPVRIAKNVQDTVTFSGISGTTSPSGAHWIEIERAGTRVNYMPQDFNQFAAQSGTTGTRIKSATPFGVSAFGAVDFPTFDLTTGDFVWGPVISPVPDDLKSTWVYFGLWYKPGATTGSNVQLILTGNTDTTATDVANQAWQFKSVASQIGAAPANITAFIKKLGASSPVTIGPTIVARVGDPARLFPTPTDVTLAAGAMPAAGSWKIGRRVLNSSPAIGQPKAWQRITTGSGNVLNTDWVSEGNL